jgi:hypothetical protein
MLVWLQCSLKTFTEKIIERILSEAAGSFRSTSRKNKEAQGDQEQNGAGAAALGVAHNEEVDVTSNFFHGCFSLLSE